MAERCCGRIRWRKRMMTHEKNGKRRRVGRLKVNLMTCFHVKREAEQIVCNHD